MTEVKVTNYKFKNQEFINKLKNNLINDLLYKFPDFEKDFKLLEIERINKKTYFVIKCLKCNSIEKKEQYSLIKGKSIKNIKCFECNKSERYRKITKENIIEELKKYNAKFIKLSRDKNSQVKIMFKCNCGNINEVNYRKGKKWKCRECVIEDYSKQYRFTDEQVREKFLNKGAEPLFETYQNGNAHQKLKFRCKCGNISETTVKHMGEKKEIKCKECRFKHKRGKNHHMWKEGSSDKNHKRDKFERRWQRAIKRKFNNTCFISNVNEKKELVSHHLEGYAKNPSIRIEESNGVCITKKLHNEFHLNYDKYTGNCTRKQFEDFYFKKTGKNFEEEFGKILNIDN